ncbi:MAG TPA: O-antigen ligase family protein, partial [Gemmatimonadales bacterium]
LYCFVWLRPPEVAGVALPAQRVLGWLALAAVVSRLLVKGPLVAGPAVRGFLRWVAVFVGFLLLLLVRQLAYGENFHLLYFVMDLSKYAAGFAIAYLCYYALTAGLVSERLMVSGTVVSGGLSTLIVFGFLGLYWLGFRSEVEILAPSFGGAVGVWPTGGALPRLAGTTAEPQQLSVVLLTPLLLMVSPAYIRRWWPVAIFTAGALFLSQSKFALVSLLVVGVYLLLVYPRARSRLALAALLLLPVMIVGVLQLPTFTATIQAGLSAGAIVERLGNLVLLLDVIREHALFGIGAGHYGVYRGQMLFGDWRYDPGYTPNMDFLKVFAETGVVGFVVLLCLLGYLVRRFAAAIESLSSQDRPVYAAFLLGALAIMLNMTIGYELLHAFFWVNVGTLLYYVDRTSLARVPRGRARNALEDLEPGAAAPA